MPWGIFVCESYGELQQLTIADDFAYESLKEGMGKYELTFLGGRKDIPDSDIANISNKVANLIRRINKGEPLNLEEELNLIF